FVEEIERGEVRAHVVRQVTEQERVDASNRRGHQQCPGSAQTKVVPEAPAVPDEPGLPGAGEVGADTPGPPASPPETPFSWMVVDASRSSVVSPVVNTPYETPPAPPPPPPP